MRALIRPAHCVQVGIATAQPQGARPRPPEQRPRRPQIDSGMAVKQREVDRGISQRRLQQGHRCRTIAQGPRRLGKPAALARAHR
eukprot:3438613-Prymnesium_polylepis.3